MKNIKNILLISLVAIFLYLMLPGNIFALSGTISASSYNVAVGENFTINISGTGHAGLFIYRDFNRNSNQMIAQFVRGQSSGSVNQFESAPGVYRYCGFVDRSYGNGIETSPNCIKVNVGSTGGSGGGDNNLNISCYGSPYNPRINERVTFISSVSGGTGSYYYSWSGDCTGTSSNCSRTFYLTGNYRATLRVESGNETRTVTCSTNVLDNNYSSGITSGTISVSSSVVYTGDNIRITVKGEDRNGLTSLGAYYKGDWDIRNVSGNSVQESWNITENNPGTYRYCGFVRGRSDDGDIKTSPYCIDVTVLSRGAVSTNECSYVGETSCSSSGLRTRCIEQNGYLKWAYESCTGNTSYGYGICSGDQKPSWSCVNGSCVYNCVYSLSNNGGGNIENDKDLPISVSLLARKKGDENWLQELKVKTGDIVEFMAIVKSNSKEGVKNAKLVIMPEKNVNFTDYIQTRNIGDLDNLKIETINFSGTIASGEDNEFEVGSKAQIDGSEDISNVKFIRESGGAGLAAIGLGFGGLFGSWWFWIILLILLFLFFYFFRKKKEQK